MAGVTVDGWKPADWPGAEPLEGRYARLERLDADAHAADLFAAFAGHDGLWDYMPYGPFHTATAYHRWAKDATAGKDPVFWAIREQGAAHASGVASFLRITPDHGTIEVGHICLSPRLQRSRAATEAMFLMMDWAFRHGYRRYAYEGRFLQAVVYKGRNRDTDWFSITDREWPALRAAHEQWLAPENFDAEGRQQISLSALTAPLLRAADKS